MKRLVLLLLLISPAIVWAQAASLVADRVAIEADGSLVAEGGVEVLYDDARLTASRVRFDPEGERLEIEGPMVLSRGSGTTLIASEAELSQDLRDGLLRSARLVLDRQVQLAAAEIAQGDGRFTRLSRVTASACAICDEAETPLWEIRASRVIRDDEELQLYFDDARLRVLGVPVAYIPRLRLPDPSLERAQGFLIPELRSRPGLGVGLAWPYFVPLGDHADLTFTPYVSPETATLEGRYRQELSFGQIAVEGAVSADTVDGEDVRGFLHGTGRIDLPADYDLRFDLWATSDDLYLSRYGYSGNDRLESAVTVGRVREDRLFWAALSSYELLEENDPSQPTTVADFDWERRILDSARAGQVWLGFSGAALERPDHEETVGRDTARLTGRLDWRHSGVFGPGLVASGRAALIGDLYAVDEDPDFDRTLSRATPAAAVALSFPMARAGSQARHLLVPRVQLSWADSYGDEVPNEDSVAVDFDEGNLFGLTRFPGDDRREEGLRVEAALSWTRVDPDGWEFGATAGRILRFDDREQFGPSSGLGGITSDWLLSAQVDILDSIRLETRSVIADSLEFTRSESRLEYRAPRVRFSGSHLWQAAEPAEDRFEDLSEIAVSGSWQFADYWTASGGLRYDAVAEAPTRAELGLAWENECMGVDLSLSRRYSRSTRLVTGTTVDFTIYLTGFGTGGNPRLAARRCNG